MLTSILEKWNEALRRLMALLMIGMIFGLWLISPHVFYGRRFPIGPAVQRKVRWEEPDIKSGIAYLLNDSSLSGVWNPITSIDSPFGENYEELLLGSGRWSEFHALRRCMYQEESYVIPGIRCTNLGDTGTYRMVPQGVCTAGNYVLISAYCYNIKNKKKSVIYVLDQTSGEYLTTLVLNLYSHVGALASDGTYLYIADSNSYKDIKASGADHEGQDPDAKYKIWKYPLSMIRSYVERRQDAVPVYLTDYIGVSVNPSFLCTYCGLVFVGDFYGGNSGGQSFMCGYDTVSGKRTVPTIALGKQVQGVDITDLEGKTYVVTSSSFGRNNLSYLSCYRLWKFPKHHWVRSPLARRKIALPNMSEDLCVTGDHLLVNFESASKKYQEQNKTQLQLDRVLNLSFRAFVRGTSLATPYYGGSTAADGTDSTEAEEIGESRPIGHVTEVALAEEDFDERVHRRREWAA